MERYYIKGANSKLFEPGRKKRNYVDADGTLYTVWVKWVAGQCIYRPHKRVSGSYRVVPDTKWHQTEQAAQAELDIEASVQGWKEEENERKNKTLLVTTNQEAL